MLYWLVLYLLATYSFDRHKMHRGNTTRYTRVIKKRSSGRQHLLDGAAVGNTALDLCLPRLRALRLERLHNVHAFDDLAKHDVAPVEPGGLDRGDEELGPVGPGAGCGVFGQ